MKSFQKHFLKSLLVCLPGLFPGLTGVPSAPSPGGNQGSRVTRHRVLGSRPGRSRQLRCPQVAGGQGGRISIQRPRLVSPAPSAPRGSPRVRGRTTKRRPAESAPARPAPPRPGFPRPRPRPRGNRSRVTASRYPEGGGGEATTIRRAGGRAGGRRGKARRRAPRQRGAGPRAVPPRHWSAPPLRPPLIGECSNSVSRRQRRCFSGDSGPGLELG